MYPKKPTIASLSFNIVNGLLLLFGVNFFYFTFGYAKGGNLVFVFTVMYGLGTLLSQALFATISKHFSRMTLLKIFTGCIIGCYILWLTMGYILPLNTILINILGFAIFFSQGLYNLVVVVMLNNTIEYDQYRFHERHASVISAVRSFSVKLSGAINQGISATVLILSGLYAVSQKITDLEILSGKGDLSKAEVLSQAGEYISKVAPYQTLILRLGMVLIPIAAIFVCYTIIKKKYTITEAEYDRMLVELQKDTAS